VEKTFVEILPGSGGGSGWQPNGVSWGKGFLLGHLLQPLDLKQVGQTAAGPPASLESVWAGRFGKNQAGGSTHQHRIARRIDAVARGCRIRAACKLGRYPSCRKDLADVRAGFRQSLEAHPRDDHRWRSVVSET